ncbi:MULTISPECIES: SGNH/GDSL hydrolase family protein [unclassified Arthrobacter]|uniref:SGNH/GDSL hydrolase family protein n=1 Tax=unclassified Arthrobacter TaxID=235627 RepID=UPI00159DE5F1|nr:MULTISPECIES: SGNH/GDSL hydrolase family protein [unclassified Arthrobacter]MCQ9165321.1 SGNH/GDSL hydrolase family protein [Arthrobacter sp. STN4]NVN00118.1 SGNH/GDSL hydrolase family protein [Arthrobacter sp. SDTb3-6]
METSPAARGAAGGNHQGAGQGHPWHRFVALGDSLTEGLGDPEPGSPNGFRGWADRVAEELSAGSSGFSYANLAVRGLLLRQVIDRELPQALTLRPDLVSIQGGGNDLLHAGADPDKLADAMEKAVMELRAIDATVLVFVGPDSGRSTIMGQFRTKIAIFNENVRSLCARHDALVADMWAMTELADPRLWSPDRLHPSALGHHAMAAMVLRTLNVPHTLAPLAPKPLPARSWRQARSEDLEWAREYFMPWVLEGLKNHSHSSGFQAKRPLPGPVTFGASVPPAADDVQPGF